MKNGKQAETKIKRGIEVYAEKLIFLFPSFCYSCNHFVLLTTVGLQTPNAWADN